MKKILTITAILLSTLSYGQLGLNQFNWNDPGFFKNSGNPFVRGYGELSDSLSAMTNYDVDYYYHAGKYFAISTWADYYHWFTSKFWYRFAISTDVYRFHYLTGNNIEMMRFLFNEFQGRSVPLSPGIERVEWGLVAGNEQRGINSYRSVAFSNHKFERENRRYKAGIAAKQYSNQRIQKSLGHQMVGSRQPARMSRSRSTPTQSGGSGSASYSSGVVSNGVTKN